MSLCEVRYWVPVISLLVMIGAIPLGLRMHRRGVDPKRAGVVALTYLALSYGSAALAVRLLCGR